MSELGLPRVSMKMVFVLSLTASSNPSDWLDRGFHLYSGNACTDIGAAIDMAGCHNMVAGAGT